MQIRGEYPAEPPPAYEDARHHANTRTFDLPPSGGIAGASSAASETPSTERNGLLGELLDRFSEPDNDPNQQQEPQHPIPPPIGDHKIQTGVSPPSPAPETTLPSKPIPHQDRKRSINTGSKPLSGTFPLYDSLSLLTHSGPLTATVIPHPANPLKPKPAELKVHSHSGTIRLETRIPNEAVVQREWGVFRRTYRTSVTTHSGGIEGRVVVGEKTVVQSHSGTLDVETVLPRPLLIAGGEEEEEEEGGGGDGGKKGKKKTKPRPASSEQLSLHTQTHSSSQEVRIVAYGTPALSREGFMAGLPQQQQQQQQQQQKQVLTSYHHTHSGKLRLHYPATWTGRIEGTIGKPTSQISIQGPGVDVIQQTPHRFLAKRRSIGGQDGAAAAGEEEGGMMANTLRFYSFSGLVEIFFD
ncbi:hypothetical protein KC343_g6272 [Hortaea werneckii]|nr:hypothetical protein KC352_g21969 [Hortaea werneckii]KAI7556733.1 hypothetical protein KC317_g12077 [Hortaea werneckii]KAI7603604.1 hypothetical protein KC346_g11810 [Hortaea werneckii]KAI7626538.1 hypothetical protein KC343_g6272 [Hortaea werneckii]KAI7647515.1 hypothetical protein KC319_g11607 [Hortaea werneckii]